MLIVEDNNRNFILASFVKALLQCLVYTKPLKEYFSESSEVRLLKTINNLSTFIIADNFKAMFCGQNSQETKNSSHKLVH